MKKIENMVFNRRVATIIKELNMSNGKQRRPAPRNLFINTTEIAQMANVSVSTVSNWKRRSDTFPGPVGTKDGKPAFDYDRVSGWLRDNNKEFHDNRMRSLVWEYANRVRGKMDAIEGSARFVALLHLRKAASEYGLEVQWQTLVDGGEKESWVSYVDAIETIEREMEHLLSNYVVDYVRGLVESDDIETIQDDVALVDAIDLPNIMEAADMVIDAMWNNRQVYLGDNGSPLYHVMAEMANTWAKTCSEPNPTFYDPACGGAFVAMRVASRNPQYRFALADINSVAAVIAQARFFLQFGKSATETIVLNDLVRNDPFPDLKCNLSVVTPPMGLSASSDTGVTDPRWAYAASNGGGRRPAFPSETAFLQDCIFHLGEAGRAFVALRPSFTTGRSFANLRRRMVADGVVEAIVSLPRRQLRDTSIPIDIWVLSKVEGRNQVHLIDCASTTEEVAQEGLPVYLSEPLNGYADGKYRWMDVTCAEILAEDNVSLAPDKWIKPEGMNPKNICLESTEEISEIRQGLDLIDDESNPLRDLPNSLANMKESRVFTLRELVNSNEAELIRGNTQSVGRAAVYQEDVITPKVLSEGMASLTKSEDVGKREHITKPGDIVFRKLGSTHAAVDVEGGHRMSHTVLALRMKGDNWIPDFVAICLQAAWNQKDTPRNIAGQIDPLDMELPVVSLEMQRKLVEIQRAADELKRLSAAAADYATTFCNAIRFGAEEDEEAGCRNDGQQYRL
ncbi:N-6 DNA methylase [Bifidobacterium animalis]|uniref:N-6 DNA methylase n=1 Tax=Bifidobacterium animalis TaxID=28025 RepID=UPI001C3E8A80|nr:N-6 DNA methylase [Bifidobacterium animalis]MCR1995154.1 SAM-dependent methyltransferase [Bifidobacterium animalis subsp. animalis]